MSHTNISLVQLTPSAIAQVHLLMAQKQLDSSYGLRLTANSHSGCAPELGLGFDRPKEQDLVFELDGLRVMLQKTAALHLAGKTLDYQEQDGQAGFLFL
ncbi:HesB/IscA family protein [Eisenibacter elegans]|uniref:HesB/IscA family protein n=1 Tax=Eisenibacter elegans TaxID=997 RepID=UPI00042694B6|nr:hypothetical protein [Eisenibacter elegans]